MTKYHVRLEWGSLHGTSVEITEQDSRFNRKKGRFYRRPRKLALSFWKKVGDGPWQKQLVYNTPRHWHRKWKKYREKHFPVNPAPTAWMDVTGTPLGDIGISISNVTFARGRDV